MLLDALLALAASPARSLCPKSLRERRASGGRIYGHGSRRYDGPRDEAHRRERPELTRERLKALNAAWNRRERKAA
jgi:hypothetical protein